jgi:hypothetical protein
LWWVFNHERFRVWLFKHYLFSPDTFSRLTPETRSEILSSFFRNCLGISGVL